MNGLPNSVTLAQVQEALSSLGIPLNLATKVTVDPQRGITVRLYVTDDAGRKQVHAGCPLMTELTIPYETPEVPDAAADG
ncbi:hypothetical protein ACH4E8_29485 [Streptomyces sp. NPDC017979]|uniref:hypothetical protein n=1 Tax=Streptomyces sp. NPDC017979 TaxID=3365024 RepID=UPI0037AB2821